MRMFALVKAWRESGRSMLACATDYGYVLCTFRYRVLRFEKARAHPVRKGQPNRHPAHYRVERVEIRR